MTLPADYLHYPRRRYGMDQDWYPWTDHFQRAPVSWPGGARVALWIVPVVEFFPLLPPVGPVKAPGGMVTPYPDLRHFTSRDYGNRVGIYRILDLLASLGLRSSAAVNSAVATRYPALIADLVAAGSEVVAHGVDMNHVHVGGLAAEEEARWIADCSRTLREASGQPVDGWLSPARSQTVNTARLLCEHGFRWFGDCVNDELPYLFASAAGTLASLPVSVELSDRQICIDYRHSADDYARQVCDAFDQLDSEVADFGGRLLCLPVTPYIAGVPYRLDALREALRYVTGRPGVWAASATEILDACGLPGARR